MNMSQYEVYKFFTKIQSPSAWDLWAMYSNEVNEVKTDMNDEIEISIHIWMYENSEKTLTPSEHAWFDQVI